jgi:hypothetical protein
LAFTSAVALGVVIDVDEGDGAMFDVGGVGIVDADSVLVTATVVGVDACEVNSPPGLLLLDVGVGALMLLVADGFAALANHVSNRQHAPYIIANGNCTLPVRMA